VLHLEAFLIAFQRNKCLLLYPKRSIERTGPCFIAERDYCIVTLIGTNSTPTPAYYSYFSGGIFSVFLTASLA